MLELKRGLYLTGKAFEKETDCELMGRRGFYTYLMDSIIRAKGVGLNVDVHFIPLKSNYWQCQNWNSIKWENRTSMYSWNRKVRYLKDTVNVLLEKSGTNLLIIITDENE